MAGYEEDRKRRLAGPTELRVHGVGGTPPENLLRDTAVLVAGTTTSGFYRRKQERAADPWQVEAYSWGGLTSGGTFLEALRKALWVVLLPFTLINAAGWMLPNPTAGGWRRGWGQRLLRWLAQFSTVGLALSLAAISVDVLGLQCGSQPACAADNSWLSWLNFDWLRFISGRPSGLIAVALLPAAIVMLVLWLISRSSSETSEGPVDPSKPDRGPDDWWAPRADQMNIARPGLWRGAQRVLGLTRVHFGSAAAAVALAYSATAVWLAREAGEFATISAILAGWALGVLGWGAALLAAGGTPGVRTGEAPGKRPATWWLLRAGILVLFLAVLTGWVEGPTWAEAEGLTPLRARAAFNWVALAVGSPAVLIIVLTAPLMLWRARRKKYGGAFLAVSLGVVAGIAILATLAVWIASIVSSDAAPIVVWPGYEAALVGVLILLAVIVVRVTPHLYRLWKNSRRPDCGEEVDEAYHEDLRLGGENRPLEDFKELPARAQGWLGSHRRWVRRRVREHRIMQYTADRIVQVATWVVAVAGLLLFWAVIDAFVTAFTDFTAGFISLLPAWGWVVTLARWIMLAALAAVFSLVADAYRNRDDRRRVGILWDVLTFWPRWFHPITPPSYAATAVPQLRDHLEAAGGHLRKPVLLSAHSQGAVLALTTVARLTSPTTRHSVALLTYGNPARRLYGRFFPDFFGREQLELARELLRDDRGVRWRNLTRCADPIGGSVLHEGRADYPCDPCPEGRGKRPTTVHPPTLARLIDEDNQVDWVVPDPYPVWPKSGDPLPDSLGHSDYDLDDPYDAAAAELFRVLGVPRTPRP